MQQGSCLFGRPRAGVSKPEASLYWGSSIRDLERLLEYFDRVVEPGLLKVGLSQVLVCRQEVCIDSEHRLAGLDRLVEFIHAVEDHRRAVVDLQGEGVEL